MGITDELRKWGYGFCGDTHDVVTAIADRIDAEHERELAEQQDSLTVGMQPMTEENMAEGGWVRGPLDADGKMWRRGDMSDSNWGVIEGIAYEDGRWFVSGHDTSAPWIPADSIRHYHEPTVEDIAMRTQPWRSTPSPSSPRSCGWQRGWTSERNQGGVALLRSVQERAVSGMVRPRHGQGWDAQTGGHLRYQELLQQA